MFLYFTKKDNKTNKIKAAYTGRFAFISDKLIYEDIEETFKAISMEERKKIEFQKYEEIQEEFLHHIIFQKNISSLFINGFRYITRLIWRLFENKKIVKLYYEYRTLFFFIMYAPQEKIVNELIDSRLFVKLKKLQWSSEPKKLTLKDFQYQFNWFCKNSNVNTNQFFKLLNYDLKYLKLLIKFTKYQNSNYISLFILFLISPILILIGFVITKFFTIILYEKNEHTNTYEHKYISKYGVVKDLNREKTIKSKIGEVIQFEKFIKKINNFDEKLQNIKWMMIKFESEGRIFDFIEENKKDLNIDYDLSIFEDFDTYSKEIVSLAFIWSDITKMDDLETQFIDEVSNGILYNSSKSLEKLIKNNPDLNRVVEFFYMHGN
ncbi:hypothetical protein [Halarcobacter sp.]|uniref:hypothetical protein n=1 Tax=Halarcobacter sp. TaxID=2321133 RepID=UPI002AAAB382|nr:hypothetical protein [Halarcobacter sp.]